MGCREEEPPEEGPPPSPPCQEASAAEHPAEPPRKAARVAAAAAAEGCPPQASTLQAPPPPGVPVFDVSGKAAEAIGGFADAVRGFGLELAEAAVSPENLALPPGGKAAKALGRVRRELLEGQGLALVRGLEWPEEPELRRLQLLVLGAGLRGRPVPQSTDFKELVADVMARPPEEGDRLYRGYRNPFAQKLHTDSNRPSAFGEGKCDVMVLHCVRQAASGGASRLLSAEALHRALAADHPRHYARLCEGWPWDGERDWMPEWGPQREHGDGLPLLSRGGPGALSSTVQWGKILRQNVEAGFAARAAAGKGAPMGEAEREALDALQQTANMEELGVRLKLEEGDVLLLNNYAWMHGRDEFPEAEADGGRRHLLRIWLKMA